MNDIERRYLLARALAVGGGQQTLQYFQQPGTGFDRKSDNSPVTAADHAAENWIRQRLADEVPQDGIVGEEFGNSAGTSEFEWIIDPIDGTKSFIAGVPLYGTMVGLLAAGKPILGAVYFPGLDELIIGGHDQPTKYGNPAAELQTASVCQTQKLSDSIFVVSEAKTFVSLDVADVFDSLQQQCYVTRTWGDAYGYYLVATGRAQLMIDPALEIWDAAAVAPIIRGAGGRFADWQGQYKVDSGHAVGMTPGIADQVQPLLQQHAHALSADRKP